MPKAGELTLALFAGFGLGLWVLPCALLMVKLLGDILP